MSSSLVGLVHDPQPLKLGIWMVASLVGSVNDSQLCELRTWFPALWGRQMIPDITGSIHDPQPCELGTWSPACGLDLWLIDLWLTFGGGHYFWFHHPPIFLAPQPFQHLWFIFRFVFKQRLPICGLRSAKVRQTHVLFVVCLFISFTNVWLAFR